MFRLDLFCLSMCLYILTLVLVSLQFESSAIIDHCESVLVSPNNELTCGVLFLTSFSKTTEKLARTELSPVGLVLRDKTYHDKHEQEYDTSTKPFSLSARTRAVGISRANKILSRRRNRSRAIGRVFILRSSNSAIKVDRDSDHCVDECRFACRCRAVVVQVVVVFFLFGGGVCAVVALCSTWVHEQCRSCRVEHTEYHNVEVREHDQYGSVGESVDKECGNAYLERSE